MAGYNKGNETKKRFIMLMYKKLCEQDASTLTVRDLAHQNGCSAAALYRHFESLEYLIVTASVRFLDEYMKEYAKLLDADENLLSIYIEGWELFNRYAFDRPDVYYRLFWGKDNCVFGNAVQEYFELFPFTGSEKYTAHYYTLLFNENMQERDFLMLRRVENMGLLAGDDAAYYSKSNTLLVKGMLSECMNKTKEERKKAELECNKLIKRNMRDVLK